MSLQCHMNEKITNMYLKIVFVTLVGVKFHGENSNKFLEKLFVFCSAWVILWHQSLGCF